MDANDQAALDIEVFGFTVLRDVLSAETATDMRSVLIRCSDQRGTEHRNRGSARHVANLPVLDPSSISASITPECCPCSSGYWRRA